MGVWQLGRGGDGQLAEFIRPCVVGFKQDREDLSEIQQRLIGKHAHQRGDCRQAERIDRRGIVIRAGQKPAADDQIEDKCDPSADERPRQIEGEPALNELPLPQVIGQ
jgi:hypothetical protein